jgi:outer membrane protein TolC
VPSDLGPRIQQLTLAEVVDLGLRNNPATRRVRTSNDRIASAEQSSEVALGRYRAGVGSVLDLLSAQTALADARAQQVLARLEWNTSLAQLAHDTGMLDTQGGNTLRLAPDSANQTPPP